MGVKTEGTDVVEYDNIPNYIYINNDGTLEVTLQGDNGMIDKEYLGFNLLSDVNHILQQIFDNLTFSTSNEDIAKVEKDVASNVVRVTANHAKTLR